MSIKAPLLSVILAAIRSAAATETLNGRSPQDPGTASAVEAARRGDTTSVRTQRPSDDGNEPFDAEKHAAELIHQIE